MSKAESTVAPAVPIPRSALVAGSGHGAAELTRDLRSVAMEAASQWVRAQSTSGNGIKGLPEDFGAAAAKVYLAALYKLNAGFEPVAECPAERA